VAEVAPHRGRQFDANSLRLRQETQFNLRDFATQAMIQVGTGSEFPQPALSWPERAMRERPRLITALIVAIAAIMAAWGARVVFAPILGDRVPFITFFPMVFALAWWGGFRPTFLATVISSVLLTYFILEPANSFAITRPEYRYGLGIYIAVALAAGLLGERMHLARWAARQSANHALAEHERLRVTLSSIGDAVIVTNANGLIVSMNPLAELVTGWKQEHARDKPLGQVLRIVNEDTRQSVEDPCAKVLKTGKVIGLANHTILIAKDGVERPIDDSAAPIYDASGKIQGVVVVFRDVTEKRRADRELSRSQRQLTDFFENSEVSLHSVGPDGIILSVNQAELDMLGYSRDEYVGHHIAEFHVDRGVIDDILARLSRGEILHNYEAQLRCKTGAIKDVLITASVFWEDGKFIHTRCFTRDNTERKQAEDALTYLANASTTLAALVDRHSALQQSARIAVAYLADWCVVYVIDEHGDIDYHAHAHRDPAKEPLLATMLTKSPLDWSSNTATVRALRTGEPVLMADLPEPFLDSVAQSEEHREIIRQLHPHAVIAVPLKIRERTIGVIGLVSCEPERQYTDREVTLAENLAERVATAVDNSRLYHAVKEANKQKDEFLAMLAHELRNPLAAIRYAVALGQMSNGDSTTELFEIVDRQTQSLAHLIDDLLDVSRISGDKVTLRREHIEVASIVARAAETVRPLMEQKRHDLVLDVADEPMVLHADPTRAVQIVANLLTNSGKYTHDGGQITVRARRQNNDAIIEVIDTGVGLPPEMLNRVFELFAQADRTLDRSEGGLGIGLTVARKLAELHGGEISVSSEGLGKGATFTVRLPLSSLPSQISPAPEPDVGDSVPEAMRVLVVDDNRDTAHACSKLLQQMGHEVDTAYDGLAALEHARSFRPQVLFLDIGLPRMNGYEVSRALRDEGFQDAVIIAVSGYGQPDDRRRSREAGFDHHLVKPVDRAAIVRALKCTRQEEPAAS
jgi:PAS domain S-box-containing protein